MGKTFEIGGFAVGPGERRVVELPVARLANYTPVTLPVHVVHGAASGPTLFVSAAIHGDEINGIEIIHRLLHTTKPETLAGTLLAIPIVNAFGFLGRSRYLPDRRDLNRSFPGSASGSLAARLANLFLNEVVKRSNYGIDLHTAAIHRTNLPQIRSAFHMATSRDLANAFGAPVVLKSDERTGSLRRAARDIGVDVLVYEGGEGLRLDEFAVKSGVDGVLGVMHQTGMIGAPAQAAIPLNGQAQRPPIFADASKWVRAPESGILRSSKRLGDAVGAGEVIATVANPYEGNETPVRAPRRGIIVGRSTLPTVNMGDALFHIAWSAEMASPPRTPDAHKDHAPEPVMDEDEII